MIIAQHMSFWQIVFAGCDETLGRKIDNENSVIHIPTKAVV